MKYLQYTLGLAGALAILGLAQNARATTLTSLISGGSVTSNGLVYSNFTESGNLAASKVSVTFSSTGVKFTAAWNTLTVGSDNAVIGYTVSVAPTSGKVMQSSNFAFSGSEVILNAPTTATSSLTDINTNNQYNAHLFDDGPGHLTDSLSNSVTFNPASTSMHVINSINIAASTGAFASLNFVDTTVLGNPVQGVVPPPPAIPEPMSLVLLPLALVGLGLRKRMGRGA